DRRGDAHGPRRRARRQERRRGCRQPAPALPSRARDVQRERGPRDPDRPLRRGRAARPGRAARRRPRRHGRRHRPEPQLLRRDRGLVRRGRHRARRGRAARRRLRPGQPRAAALARRVRRGHRSEEHTSELQSRENLVCRLLLETKKTDTPEKKKPIKRKRIRGRKKENGCVNPQSQKKPSPTVVVSINNCTSKILTELQKTLPKK